MADRAPVWIEPDGAASNSILTLDQLKDQAFIAGDEEDSKLQQIINGVNDTVEKSLGRPVRKRAYNAYFADPPCRDDVLLFERTPIISIDGLQAYENGAWVDVPSTEWYSIRTWNDTLSPPPVPTEVYPALDSGWSKIDHDNRPDPFRVKYTAGWDPIPDGIVAGALLLAVDRYNFRGTLAQVEMYRTGTVVQTMLLQYKRARTVRFIQ